MRLHIYRSLDDEYIPEYITHVIVDDSVTIIRRRAFYGCKHLVSLIMGDNVKRIEDEAFCCCRALRFVQLSKTLEYIGDRAFIHCHSLEALFLPSTVKLIEGWAFTYCRSLRLLIVPNDIDLNKVGQSIVADTGIKKIARAAGVEYERDGFYATGASNRRVNEWLIHHLNISPFHKLCYNSSITTRSINGYLIENGNGSTLQIDATYGMIPLHMLTINPNAPTDSIAALLDSNMEAVFCLDYQQKTPLDYARDYNVGGLVGMIAGLCSHRN